MLSSATPQSAHVSDHTFPRKTSCFNNRFALSVLPAPLSPLITIDWFWQWCNSAWYAASATANMCGGLSDRAWPRYLRCSCTIILSNNALLSSPIIFKNFLLILWTYIWMFPLIIYCRKQTKVGTNRVVYITIPHKPRVYICTQFCKMWFFILRICSS